MMNMKIKSLIIHNLLLTKSVDKGEIILRANTLKKHIIEQNFYSTGPTLYTCNKKEGYRVGATVNTSVILENYNILSFYEKIELSKCIYARVFGENMDNVYQQMYEYANKNNLKVIDNTFYHVLLDVYGEVITDVYLQVE